MRKREYSLYLIKPDGVKSNIQEIVHSYIKEHNYIIEDERSIMLPADKINMLFNTGVEKKTYIEYMTEGHVIVGVCSGIDVCQGLFDMKMYIREKYNCIHSMRNLIHCCEPGLEAMCEFNYFFPEWRQNGWKPTADMYIPINQSNYEKTIDEIVMTTNLEYAGLILMDKKIKISENYYLKTKILYGVQLLSRHQKWNIPVIAYFSYAEQAIQALELSGKEINKIIEQVQSYKGILTYGYFPYDLFCKEMVTNICQIKNIYLFDPRYKYDELNTIEHWSVVVNGMNYIGGSNGMFPLGEFGVPASAVLKILNDAE